MRGDSVWIAILDEDNVCYSVNRYQTPLETFPPNYIEIEEGQDVLWRKYENGQWSQEKYPPEIESAETIEEKLDRLERDFQETKLVQYDALATIFEEILLIQDKLNGGGTND